MSKTIATYTHPSPAPAQAPDTKPGDYYVSIKDGNRTSLALGPFTDDHAGALARVDEVRFYVSEKFAWGSCWAFGTCRIDTAAGNPEGKLNGALGLGPC